jgi:hypothetical protein
MLNQDRALPLFIFHDGEVLKGIKYRQPTRWYSEHSLQGNRECITGEAVNE